MASRALLPCPGAPFEAVGRLVAGSLAGAQVEIAAFAYCDGAGRILGLRHAGGGAADAVELPVRRVAIDALTLDAAVVVMAHNHPRGEAWPSRADREATRRLAGRSTRSAFGCTSIWWWGRGARRGASAPRDCFSYSSVVASGRGAPAFFGAGVWRHPRIASGSGRGPSALNMAR